MIGYLALVNLNNMDIKKLQNDPWIIGLISIGIILFSMLSSYILAKIGTYNSLISFCHQILMLFGACLSIVGLVASIVSFKKMKPLKAIVSVLLNSYIPLLALYAMFSTVYELYALMQY